MNRSIFVGILIGLFAVLAPAPSAFADDPAPTKEQLDAAKKAFGEGKTLFDAGKLPEAIDKFKESYRLSRNPLLLYNIGFTLDQAGQKDTALFYYRKFLNDAPKDAAQRKEVSTRVDAIEKEKLEADLAGTSTPAAGTTGTTGTKPEEKKTVEIKPPGTYSAADFKHQAILDAPPGKPLDITAAVPEDSGFEVTLFYRGSGDTKFNEKKMKWRYNELVGRVPPNKVYGTAIQYYIEVKDTAGTKVAAAGKSTSPNLVTIDPAAEPKFYPDLSDEGEMTAASQQNVLRHDEEDPFANNKNQATDDELGGGTGDKTGPTPEVPSGPGTGFRDVGSTKFASAKWASTGVAGVAILTAVSSYFLAKSQATNLVNDSNDCPMGQMPPCRVFDKEYDAEVQAAGKRWQTIHQVTTVVGIGAAAVAGYFWYRELTSKKRGEDKVSSKNASPETTWAITPSVGSDGFTGAAAMATF
ncbi:MAG: hypothetical protein HOV81_22515 [Kofleriaceae bacterium]|nr:hypothetical protein [Kofleriaceae bacterium]